MKIDSSVYESVLEIARKNKEALSLADFTYALGVGYRKDSPSKASVKAALDAMVKTEPGFTTWKIGNSRFYGWES